MPTNSERALRARHCLKSYAEEAGNADEPAEEAISDLLSDVMHMLAEDGEAVDWDMALRVARMNYDAERREDA